MNIETYIIKDWDKHYENNRSRTVRDLSWVPIPNRHDGEAYSRLMVHKDAAIIFTVWVLLLQVASRCHPRGSLLTSAGQPHNSESLSIKTRGKLEWFEKSIPFLVQIGWLSVDCQEGVSCLSASCQSGDEEGREGKEWKEGKGTADEVIKLWNTTNLPKCLQITEKRKSSLKARVSEPFFSDNWRVCLDKVGASNFCNGQNDRGWKADIDWFLRPDTAAKILEGKYDNKNGFEQPKKEVRMSLDEYNKAKEGNQ